MEKLVGKIRNLLAKETIAKRLIPLLPKNKYAPIPFSEDNLRMIPAISPHLHIKATFIDGGHAVLLESMDWCVGFIRVHAVTFNEEKRIGTTTLEAYVLVSSAGKHEQIAYTTEIIPLKGDIPIGHLLDFDSLDETIRFGIRRSSPTAMVGIARRFAELYLAEQSSHSLGKGDIITIDGTLQKSYTHEEKLLDPLRVLSEHESSPSIIGCCKTNSLFTEDGRSFSNALSKYPDKWVYAPIATPLNGSPHISFVRLHEKSPQVFMLESFNPLTQKDASILASYATDPVFLGYPYGLIEADRAARVSMQESASLQFQLKERLGKSFESLIKEKNAHNILDKIAF